MFMLASVALLFRFSPNSIGKIWKRKIVIFAYFFFVFFFKQRRLLTRFELKLFRSLFWSLSRLVTLVEESLNFVKQESWGVKKTFQRWIFHLSDKLWESKISQIRERKKRRFGKQLRRDCEKKLLFRLKSDFLILFFCHNLYLFFC